MKSNRWIILGIIASLVIAFGAYFWATGIMDSLYAFRSPLKDNPPAPGPALGQPLTRRVVFVLIDALRDDTSHKKGVMPFLNQLRDQGAWATNHSRTPSYSEPGYSVLMTGAWPDLSDGPAMNLDYPDIPTWTQDNLFTAAQRAGLKTAVSGFNWFEKLIPQSAVNNSFYTPGEDKAADVDVVNAALPWLKENKDQFILIHIDQVDYAGHHEGGPQSPNWDAAATRADGLLKQIVSTLDLSTDTVIVVSDHGQIDRGGHGGQDPIVLVQPFVMAGAGIKPGGYPDGSMADVATTTAALLGLNIPADSEGIVRTDMLNLTADQQTNINTASLAQKSQLLKDYQAAIHSPANNAPIDSVGGILSAMDQAKAQRENAERIPRFVLAILLALIPVYFLIKKRSSLIAWMLGGALLYIALFNFGYAVLAGRTYSLSSVASASDIIMFTASTTASSLALAWLFLGYIVKWFNFPPREAAEKVLAFTFITLYLVSLPILWHFALNGLLVTWTIPDMASMFMGFLSILQALVIAITGLILVGVTALIAKINQRQRTSSPL
ncbi:MAG: alkaline phosphatase family protein [Chloroflexi bacterium]|nr:alkaline phosphatase family protein [Chloroflexota bacterium]